MTPDHEWVRSEFALPQFVRKDDDRVPSRNLVFLGPETSAKLRFDTKHLEKITADQVSHLQLWLCRYILRKPYRNQVVGKHAIERPALTLEVEKVRVRQVAEISGGRACANVDHL